MAEVDINDLAKTGVVRDEPAYQLPPEMWNVGLNMRARDNGLVKLDGWAQVFGTPTVPPHFAVNVVSASQSFWIYTSLTKAYVYDGSTHTEITRLAGNYTAAATQDWNSTLFGGIPILNNGADAPQYWPALTIATKLLNLANWPANNVAKVIRAFGSYLVAIYVTKPGGAFPHMVKWSNASVGPGILPSTWDETDETEDAGEYDLPDVQAGILHDAMQLGTKLFLYKEQSTWSMRFVGGRAVFAFDPVFDTMGILAPRCVAITGDSKYHVVATTDDIIIHDGSKPQSILEKKLKRELFNNLDTTNYHTSFMYTDPENTETIFVYPESGHTQPNRAVIFNYRTGAITEADGVTYRNAAPGKIESATAELWSDGTDIWDVDTGPWDLQERRKVVLCGTDATKFYQLNSGSTRDTVEFTGTLQRIGLALLGKKRTGEWIVDFEREKMVDRVWPKVQGGPIEVRLGYQDQVGGTVTWGAYVPFDPTTSVFADSDPPVSGRAIALEFRSAFNWRLDGYKINVSALGNF